MLYHVATSSPSLHRPPRLYPPGTPCDDPAPAPCNPGESHGSLSLSSHRALAPRQRVSKTSADDGNDDSCCASFQPRNNLQRTPQRSHDGLAGKRRRASSWMGKRSASTHIRGGHHLSSGGDCTPLHGGTLTMPHPHPRNKAHQAVMFLAGFRTGIRVSQTTVTEKECMEQELGVGSLGQNTSWSPRQIEGKTHAWLV